MSQYKNILVAIDVNAQYGQVIEKAKAIKSSDSELHLVYISLPLTYVGPYLYGMNYSQIDDNERLLAGKNKLNDIAKEFGIKEENVHFKVGEASDEIHTIADQTHADLIVIGTHGRSGIKLLLGSTANSVLHGVKQDVLAVRIKD